MEAVTLWADEFEEDEPPAVVETGSEEPALDEASLRLAIAGAVWTSYAFLGYRDVLKPSEWRKFLDTPRWRSYALVQMGSARRPNADPRDLLQLYVRARDEDPRNLGAVFNLAVARVRLKDKRTRALLDRLENALPGPGERPFEPLRYQVAYQRGALDVHEHYEGGDATDVDLPARRTAVGQQLAALEDQLRGLLERGDHRDREELDRTAELRRLEGPLVVLWAVLADLAPPGPAAVATVTTRQEFATALTNDAMTANAAVEWLHKQASDVSEQTHYNLACYYGANDDTHEVALQHLAQGTHSTALYKWANDDPSLKRLRTAHPERWKEALAFAHPEPEPPQGLAAIQSIGEQAQQLATLSIDRPRQLLDRALTSNERRELARRLVVSPLLVERWARLCEVKYRLDLTVDELNLLDRASLGSIGALRLQTPKRLESILKRASANGVPDRQTLQRWIREAREEPEQVQPPLSP